MNPLDDHFDIYMRGYERAVADVVAWLRLPDNDGRAHCRSLAQTIESMNWEDAVVRARCRDLLHGGAPVDLTHPNYCAVCDGACVEPGKARHVVPCTTDARKTEP